jgi:hypothetical protein
LQRSGYDRAMEATHTRRAGTGAGESVDTERGSQMSGVFAVVLAERFAPPGTAASLETSIDRCPNALSSPRK